MNVDEQPLRVMLRQAWCEALGLAEVGDDDDFFALGGESLQAMAMLETVHRHTGRRLPASVLLDCPTVASLARHLGETPAGRGWSRIVTMNEGGDKTPLVAVHGAGDVLFYARLGAALDAARPLVAIQAALDDEGRYYGSIRALASAYVDDLRGARPRGPYLLGGFCIGSEIALEMARQLRAAGEAVPALVLFDTTARLPEGRGRGLLRRGRSLLRRAAPATPPHVGAAARRAMFANLGERYVAQPFDGTVIYVQSRDFANDPVRAGHLERARWIGQGRLTVVESPGGHNSQFDAPHVDTLGRRLSAALDAVT